MKSKSQFSTEKPRLGILGRFDYKNLKITAPMADLFLIRYLIEEYEKDIDKT